ncbi:MAG: FG-GAP-like repeat-containing protein, partial [Sandaracinaceae bacterium]
MHASALSAAVWIATWVAMVLTGCTLDFGKYTGPGDLDASAMDASRSDAGPDAGPRRDAGPDATLDAPTGFLTITSVTPNKGVGNSVQTVRIAGTGFTASTTVTFGGAPSSRVVLVSDVELEADVPVGPEIGAIDVVVAEGSLENTLAGGYRRVNGTIRFRAGIRSLVSSLAVGSTPARVALSTGLLAGGDADVDAVVVTSSPSEVVALSTGDGAGGFGDPATDVSLPVDGLDVTVADFDGDGAEDIVVLQADRVTVYGTASDTLTESSRYVLMGGRALSVLDYDHVGGLDMIVRGDAMSGALSLLRNSGTGVFTTAPPLPLDAMYALNDATTPGDVADFDGDGFVDYAVGARRDPSTPVVLVYLRTASPPAFRATPTAIVIDG